MEYFWYNLSGESRMQHLTSCNGLSLTYTYLLSRVVRSPWWLSHGLLSKESIVLPGPCAIPSPVSRLKSYLRGYAAGGRTVARSVKKPLAGGKANLS